MKIYNTDTLVKVEVTGLKECKYLVFEKAKKRCFFRDTEEGFYELLGFSNYSKKYSKEELEEGKFYDTKLIVENNVAYYKPYVTLYFGDQKQVITFNTFEDAVRYGSQISDKYMTNKLIF